MNTYTTEFFAQCPNNGMRIKYSLRIDSMQMIPVEQITAAVENVADDYHEEIADHLHAEFGGRQTLTAEHHGVTVQTTRPWQFLDEPARGRAASSAQRAQEWR